MVWSMGNDAPMGQFGPNSYITGMMFNWNLLIQTYCRSTCRG